MAERWVWLSGWGIAPQDFVAAARAWRPAAEHLALPPEPDAVDEALRQNPTRLGAYSLGSLLLLERLDEIPRDLPLLCLAPITGFCREHRKGGTTPVAVLQSLEARLASDPPAALKLFYRLAGIRGSANCRVLPDSSANLAWGLQALRQKLIFKPDLKRVRAVIAEKDRLLDAPRLAASFKHNHIVNASHDYIEIFQNLPQNISLI